MYLISEKYTNQYSDPNFPGEYPMTGVVAEIHDGTNGWIIYAESDDDTYEVHKEQITHFIKSFSLTVTSDTHLALVESPSSVTPPIATPAPMPIPTPEAPISLPSQSKTIEGAFLNIEKSEISISQSDELIQLYGNIGREPNKGERVIINIVYPDGTTNGHTLIPSKDGYFEIPERIDRNSPIGTYQFDAMLRDSFIGKTTLIVNEYSYASQSSTTTTEVSPSVINPTMPPVNQLTNESDYSITTKESGETSQTTQKYTSGIFDDGYQDDEVWFNIPEGWIITGEPRGEEGLMIQHPDYDGLVMVGIDFSRYSLDAEIEKFQNEALESASSCDFKWETKEYNNSVDWSDGTYDFYFTEFECDYDGVGQKIDIVGQSILMKTGEKIITFFYMANVDEKGILSDTYSSIWDTFGFEPEISISQKSSEGGGCLIATAAFGSEMAPQVQFLREIRDNTVMSTESGTTFMTGFNQFYYSFSPAVADLERENPVFKETVKVALTPMLTSLTLLNYVDVDTEEEMLGYGIGIILLNIGMYFVAPAVLIIALKKRLDSFRGPIEISTLFSSWDKFLKNTTFFPQEFLS